MEKLSELEVLSIFITFLVISHFPEIITVIALRYKFELGPAGLAVKAAGLARGERGFDSHRSHAR